MRVARGGWVASAPAPAQFWRSTRSKLRSPPCTSRVETRGQFKSHHVANCLSWRQEQNLQPLLHTTHVNSRTAVSARYSSPPASSCGTAASKSSYWCPWAPVVSLSSSPAARTARDVGLSPSAHSGSSDMWDSCWCMRSGAGGRPLLSPVDGWSPLPDPDPALTASLAASKLSGPWPLCSASPASSQSSASSGSLSSSYRSTAAW